MHVLVEFFGGPLDGLQFWVPRDRCTNGEHLVIPFVAWATHRYVSDIPYQDHGRVTLGYDGVVERVRIAE